jgi:hypothetical protein
VDRRKPPTEPSALFLEAAVPREEARWVRAQVTEAWDRHDLQRYASLKQRGTELRQKAFSCLTEALVVLAQRHGRPVPATNVGYRAPTLEKERRWTRATPPTPESKPSPRFIPVPPELSST